MVLGRTYRDKITGFTGVLTGIVNYISGCSQGLIAPPVDTNGNFRESNWFDLQRLEDVPHALAISLDNSESPGFDKPAPRI